MKLPKVCKEMAGKLVVGENCSMTSWAVKIMVLAKLSSH
jgi:hypothetical protein